MRAIFINSFEQTVTEINIKGNDFRLIRDIIGCGIISGGYVFSNKDFMYVDDEFLFKDQHKGFTVHEETSSFKICDILGNALIVGSGEPNEEGYLDGHDHDVKSTVEYIKSLIEFKEIYEIRYQE